MAHLQMYCCAETKSKGATKKNVLQGAQYDVAKSALQDLPTCIHSVANVLTLGVQLSNVQIQLTENSGTIHTLPACKTEEKKHCIMRFNCYHQVIPIPVEVANDVLLISGGYERREGAPNYHTLVGPILC